MLALSLYKKIWTKQKQQIENYKGEGVISNNRVRIKSDLPIETELRVDHNKPDLKAKEIMLIEVGITNKNILTTTEVTKGRKYEMLANELKSIIYPGTSTCGHDVGRIGD